MPVILVDRLPLPSLKTYTVISVALLSCSVYYAVQVTSDVNWKANATASHEAMATSASMGKLGESSFNPSQSTSTKETVSTQAAPVFKSKPTLGAQITEVVTYMVQEPLCIWVSMETNLFCLLNQSFSIACRYCKLIPSWPFFFDQISSLKMYNFATSFASAKFLSHTSNRNLLIEILVPSCLQFFV